MTLSHPKLRWPIAIWIASLLIGATIFQFSLNLRMAAQSRLLAERSAADEAARSVQEAPAWLIQDQTNAALYSRIRNSGFIGPENRAGWISSLAQTQNRMQLSSLAWHLSPQARSRLSPELYVSRMVVSASPLDPASLTRLLAHLRSNAPGRFSVDRCTLSLDPDGVAGQANCQLDWWTLAQHEH